MTMTDFARLVGCRREYISLVINGKKVASPLIAGTIEKVTNGEVKAEELRRVS